MLVQTPSVIDSLRELSVLCERWRAEGNRVVTTNGCFDLVHAGHIETLTFAKRQGDILIVGVDTDEHVAQIKGRARPIIPLTHRMVVLSALRPVDVVVPIDNVMDFLNCVRPDVHVKGGDYQAETLPEYELVRQLGGRTEIAPHVHGMSTSTIERGIRCGGMPKCL